MIWNIVSDSSCDLQMSQFSSESVRFETVPLRIQVGEREFVDNDDLDVPVMLAAMAEEMTAHSQVLLDTIKFFKVDTKTANAVAARKSPVSFGTKPKAAVPSMPKPSPVKATVNTKKLDSSGGTGAVPYSSDDDFSDIDFEEF